MTNEILLACLCNEPHFMKVTDDGEGAIWITISAYKRSFWDKFKALFQEDETFFEMVISEESAKPLAKFLKELNDK